MTNLTRAKDALASFLETEERRQRGRRSRVARSYIAPNRRAPIDVLELRAWARAYLWSIGQLTLHEAQDVLQRDAERDGLVDEIGQDAVQKILSAAFAPYREAAR